MDTPPLFWSFETTKLPRKDTVRYKLLCHRTKKTKYADTVEALYEAGEKHAYKQDKFARCVFFRFF